MSQDSGERSRVLGSSCFFCLFVFSDWLYNINTLPHVFSAVKHRSSAARSKPAMLHKIIPPMAAYDIEALVRLLNEVKKSTNSKGSTPKTQNMNIAGLDAIKNRHRRNSHSSQVSNHLLVHILDQARKGHVTSSMMSHWMERIKDDMADGSISHSEFNEFMRQLSEHTSTDPYSDHCCWFG